ncbi:MAG: hypothetical protein ABR981_05270, partial [Candidatus Micrarchaeaceae archaeon]
MSIRYTRNLKGFVFTLDAVFALIVAAVGVSILLYVDFTNPASYASSTLQAYNILQNMIQTTTLSNYGGSPYLSALAVSYNGTA